MKKKINARFLVITALAILSTLTLTTSAFYELFQQEVKDNLRTYAYVLDDTGAFLNDADSEPEIRQDSNLRVTVIRPDGSVYYDNNADIGEMDNHSERPEVVEAFEAGEGESVRRSSTMDKNTYYYAVRLENGSVLRVSKEADSIYSVFKSVFPVIGLMALALFAFCLILAHFLTKSLMTPVEQLASHLDSIDSVDTYKEMVPFINTIQKQHEDILKSSKMRQEFTANVSHELKTPLTSISGYSELIANGMAADDDVIRFAGEIHQNSNRLLTLINDIIRLSELDVMDVDVQFEMVNLYSAAKNCVDMLQVNAESHDVSISVSGRECEIYANKEMIDELIYNLCDNAIRYNNKGGSVKVFVGMENEKTVLSVKDTGIGIPAEHQERVFERFYRVDKSRSKLTGGTGLGLAIVKHIVAQHNAEMELHSELGKGTEIKIIFSN